MEELLKALEGNVFYKSPIRLSCSEQSEILAYIKRQDATIVELKEEVRELQVELADAWAQVLHG